MSTASSPASLSRRPTTKATEGRDAGRGRRIASGGRSTDEGNGRSVARSRPARLAVGGLALCSCSSSGPPSRLSLARFTDSASSSGGFTAATLNPPTGVSATGGSTVTLSGRRAPAPGRPVTRSNVPPRWPAPTRRSAPPRRSARRRTWISPAAGTYWYRLSTYIGSWTSATTTPVSATVSELDEHRREACASGSNAADTGGNGNGYETTPNNACASDGAVAVDPNTGSPATRRAAPTPPTTASDCGATPSDCPAR